MKALITLIVLLVTLCIFNCTPKEEAREINSEIPAVVQKPDSVLRHVVMFKFKEDADPIAIKKAEDAFVDLPNKILQIQDFEWGINNSPEGINKGLTHCYLLTFYSEEDRDNYLPHPEHKAFGALLDGILEDVTVVDYWAKR